MTPDERQPGAASSRTTHKGLCVAFAAMLGAVTGTLIVRQQAQACTGAIPEWDLQLNRTTEPDESIWPDRPFLQDGYGQGPLLLWNRRARDPKIDHLQAGTWGRH